MEIVSYLRGECSKSVGSYALEEGIAKANWFREYYNNRNSKNLSYLYNLMLGGKYCQGKLVSEIL